MARATGGTPATVVLDRAAITYRLHGYSLAEGVEPGRGGENSYGEAVAAAIGIPADQVFKTLLTLVDGELVSAVVPVDSTLDLKSLAAALHAKRAELAPVALAERTTGYVVGGISPLGQRKQTRTVIDESVELFDTIFVSAGKRGLQVEIDPSDLVALTTAVVAAIARQ